ncbi:MAG: hypothetical protein RXP99_05970 [Vulcanisaeta sp.]
MRPLLAILIIIVTAAVLATAYVVVTNQNAPTTALLNARKLLGRNVTATYYVTITQAGTVMGNVFPGAPPNFVLLSGEVTISRTPLMDAVVINGTLSPMLLKAGIKINVALWRFDDELCYASRAEFMGIQSITHCIHYINLTRGYVAVLNESRYIGRGSWNGETTYCFSSLLTVNPGSTFGDLFKAPLIINVTKLCLLTNGVPANASVYIYPARQYPFGGFVIGINITLVNYSFVFNQEGFAQVTGGLIPG